jgi:diguanylate cyclase (GGDEF)-like protein/PAS domain S-box-containing protein
MKNIKNLLGKKIDLYSTIMNNEYMHVYFKDRDSRFLDASLAQIRGLGCSLPEEVIGKTDRDFFSEKFAAEARLNELKVMETGMPLLNKIERLLWLTGEISWMQVNKYPLLDDDGDVVGTWGMSFNVTAITDEKRRLEEANTELEDEGNFYKRQCVIDDMTELFNRRKFFEEVNNEFEKIEKPNQKGSEFCISFLDIDNFKTINDRFGHLFGDFIISETAAIIRANVRPGDTAFRFGGDEFLIIYKKTNKDGALAIMEKIRKSLGATSFTRNGVSTNITISGGIASSLEAGNIDDLIHFADKRLYQAKDKGKDKIVS